MRKILVKNMVLTFLGASLLSTTAVYAAEETNFDLGTVVVTANRQLNQITETKADVSVITRDMIEKHHMTTVEEALRVVPGVVFLNYGAGGQNANLSGVRINGSKDIIVLVDGVRVRDFEGNGNSGYFYSAVLNNMQNIERIEVMRGGAGVVYGNTGRGGVINIITRKINSNESKLDISAGTFGKKKISIASQGRQDAWKYNVYATNNKKGDIRDGAGIY